MSRVKTSLDHKRIRCLIWLVLTVSVLLGYSLQSVAGSAYYSLVMQDYGTVSSPPVILQNGTAGTSTIYANNTSAKASVEAPLFDYVDNNDADVDSSADMGMHSNFPAQQAGPDSIYDTLAEENTEAIEDYVDNIGNVDNSTDVGTHSNFNNMKFKDGNYDVVSEAHGAIIYENSAESYSEIGQSSHSFDYSLQTASGNNRLVVVTVSAEDTQTGYATSVKFNNQEMKDVANLTVGTGYSEYVGLWYFIDSDLPSSAGNYSVAVTFSEAMEREIYVAVAEYTGVKQSAPDDYDTDSLTLSGSISVTLTAADDGSLVVAGAGQSGTNSWDNTNNIDNLQTQLLTSSGSALGHHTNVDSGDITVGWNNLNTRECMVGAVWQPAENDYGLDLEVQWTSVIDFLPAEKLCIHAGTLGAEDLNVDFWNGTGWENLATDLNAYSCNEVAVSLTSATFTIRFRDDTTVGDTTQDEWQIDASLLRVEGAGDKEDAVDNDTSDEDSSSDLGVLTDFTNMTTYDANMANLTETTGGVDGDWGDTNNPGGTSSPQITARAMGGISPDVDNMTLTSISVWWGGTGTGRLAVYQGGALDNPTGATLVWDAGQVAIPETAGWVTISGGSASLAKNTPTWIAWKCNDANYYYRTSWDSTSDFQSGLGRAQLNDEGAASTDVWDATIGTFSFGYYWYDIYINYTVPANYQLDQEVQWTDVPYLLPNENLSIYGGTMGVEDIEVDVWNGTGWETVFTDLSSGWNNASITNWLTTSNFTIRFKGGTETGDTNETTWQIDVALVHVWNDGGESYELDLEVQWTNADYDETNEELCIHYYERNTHSLDATGGYMIVGDGTPDWGSTTGTISFWTKWDTVSNRTWGQHDNMETRFSSSNLVVDWGTFDSITSNTSFAAGKWYFIAIVWNENTDDLYLYVGDQDNPPTEDTHIAGWTDTVSDESVTENNFMASKGGVEPTDGHGDDLRYWNIDRTLAEIQSDYNTELTGFETNIRSYFKLNNNFDDTGPDNNDGSGSGSYSFSSDVPFDTPPTENIRVDVWNGTAWQNLFTDLTNGWNNISVSSYLDSSTFTIRFQGDNETGDTTQDSWHIDATVLHVWTNIQAPTGWLSGWDKRVKITIDNNDVDSPLSHFPVLVNLSSSSGLNNSDVSFIFDELQSDANRRKIAATTSDGTTQCYVEIEKWNNTNEQAWLWVKVPSISNTTDTDLYLYYDSEQADNTGYVGDSNSTPAENVWDTNFKGVWHMTQVNATDSTSNNNDGTESGGVTYTDSGKIDGADDFDGTNDYVSISADLAQWLGKTASLSVWIKTTQTGNDTFWSAPGVTGVEEAGGTNDIFWGWIDASGRIGIQAGDAAGAKTTSAINDGNWHHIAMTRDSTSGEVKIYVDGILNDTATSDTGDKTNTFYSIGRIEDTGATPEYFNGIIDEVRISNLSRSAAWLKASYESGRDDLLGFGSEETCGRAEEYDFVLQVANQVANNWTINLQVYDSSNLARLSKATISFHDGNSSDQIIVSDGSITQPEGPPYNLGGNSTIYISMSNLRATTTGTSYLYVYLKIQVPNTSTYMLYTVNFEIT